MGAPKGNIPWNKGKKGVQIYSEETRRKLSESNKGRVSPMKGKKHSEETKQKMSKSHKGHSCSDETRIKISISKKGKKHSEEARKNISIAKKGKTHKSPSKETRNKISNSNKGKHPFSDEAREKLSLLIKERFKDPTKNPFYGKNHTEENKRKISDALKGNKNAEGYKHGKEFREKCRKKRLNQVFPKKDTFIEVSMHQELSKRGIMFEKHIPLLDKYQGDIKIGDLIIECDGNHWHDFPNGTEKDHIRDKELKEAGYAVLRFWGSEINSDVESCVDQIISVLGGT